MASLLLDSKALVLQRTALSKLDRELDQLRTDIATIKSSLSSFRENQDRDSHIPLQSTQETSTQPANTTTQELIEKPSALDAALEEERLQELRRINQDLVLVNEMFK